MKKIVLILFALMAGIGIVYAEAVPIGSLYYNLDSGSKTAEVTSNPSLYSGDVSIPAQVTSNGITYDVTSIGEKAFANCVGMSSIQIPNSVSAIGLDAFMGCTGLSSVTIPESVTTLRKGATFQNCTGLESVQWNAINCTIEKNENNEYYQPFRDLSNITSFTFGSKVEVIPTNLCYGLSGLISVTVPKSVKSIEKGGTFQNCTGLTSVQWNAANCTIEKNDENKYYSPFLNLSNIKSFVFGIDVHSIPHSLCEGLSGLTEITIPDGVITIGNNAFMGCSGLSTLTISPYVASLCQGGNFQKCTGLKSVIWNAEDCEIAKNDNNSYNPPFMNLSNIKSFDFGQTASITDVLCYGLSGLTTITIPSTVDYIGTMAFGGCTGLISITSEATDVPTLGAEVFRNVNKNIPLNVPCASVQAYMGANQWKDFQIKLCERTGVVYQECSKNTVDESSSDPNYTKSLTFTADGCPTFNRYAFASWEEVNITVTAIPQDGYKFNQWNDGNSDNPRTFSSTEGTYTAYFEKEDEEKVLPGIFSVGPETKVRFSSGNLQYNAVQGTHQCADGTTQQGTWRFAEHQYDTIGSANTLASSTYNGWIDLFSWGTSGWNSGANIYQPWGKTYYYYDCYVGGENTNDLTGAYAYADWGIYNAISNGGNAPNKWRVLTKDEVTYLFYSRPRASELYSYATVNGVNGLIIFPDNWEKPADFQFTPNTSNYSTNTYSLIEWNKISSQAVFLPCASIIVNTNDFWEDYSGSGDEHDGYYWTSTATNGVGCYYLLFSKTQFNAPYANNYRSDGMSVRLVQNTLAGDTAVSICEGNSFTWHGTEYSTTGKYEHTYQSVVDGKDSIVTLHMMVIPLPSLTVRPDTTILIGDSALLWATGADYLRWEPANTIKKTFDDKIFAYPQSTTVYTVTGYNIATDINGNIVTSCEASKEVTVKVTGFTETTESVTLCEKELPYTWGGRSINSKGTYQDTLISSSGKRDSIAILQLTVNPTLYGDTIATVCFGESLTWRGTTYSSSVTQTATLQSLVTGCDSIVTLHLTQVEPSDSIETATICAGNSYTWHGKSYTASTNITDTLINAAGCDSICALQLTVLPSLSGDTAATFCCNCNPFVWHGVTYNAAGDYQYTYTASNGCDSIVTLHLTQLQSTDSTEIVSLCEGESHTWHGRTYSSSIDTMLTIPNAVGCDSVCYLYLTVNPKYHVEETLLLCDTLLPMEWNGQTIAEAGTYYHNGQTLNGCDSTAVLNLQVVTCLPPYCDTLAATLAIADVCADDESLFVDISWSDGQPATYSVSFGEEAVAQGFKSAYKGDVQITSANTAQIAIPIPKDPLDRQHYPRPNVYKADITLTDTCGTTFEWKAQEFTIHYPSWLLLQRWNDVISICNEDYNGGYVFSSIRWFHEGNPIEGRGEKGAYIYQLPNLVYGDAYWAELTRMDDGVTLTTCPYYPTQMADEIELGEVLEPYVTVTPNVVKKDHLTLTVQTNICGVYFVYNSDGNQLYRHAFCPPIDESFTIDLTPYVTGTGMYMITFQGIEGSVFTSKVLVEP